VSQASFLNVAQPSEASIEKKVPGTCAWHLSYALIGDTRDQLTQASFPNSLSP